MLNYMATKLFSPAGRCLRQLMRTRGGTHTVYTATCADEGGTQGALFMCYSYIANHNGNQALQANN